MEVKMRAILICALSALVSLPLAAQQQSSATQPTASSNSSGQKNDRKKDQKDQKQSAAQANPFPAAKSEAARKKAAGKADDLPSAPAAPPAKLSTAAANPFPEARSEKAAHEVQQAEQKQEQQERRQQQAPPPSAGSSSSAIPGLAPVQPQQPSSPEAGQPLSLNPKLGKKDTNVGMFYLETGDYKGAYDRFREAVEIDPGNADAVYGLAESARQLGKTDIAIRYFTLYIEAIPYGHHAKQVRKALKEMGVEPGR
jgi:tetratricopeptide (TPR) repeat protein